jgi:hypothetical protein
MPSCETDWERIKAFLFLGVDILLFDSTVVGTTVEADAYEYILDTDPEVEWSGHPPEWARLLRHCVPRNDSPLLRL